MPRLQRALTLSRSHSSNPAKTLLICRTGGNQPVNIGHYKSLIGTHVRFGAAGSATKTKDGDYRLEFHTVADANLAFDSVKTFTNGEPSVAIRFSGLTQTVIIRRSKLPEVGCKMTFENIPGPWARDLKHVELRKFLNNSIIRKEQPVDILSITPVFVSGTKVVLHEVAVMFSAPPVRLLLQDCLMGYDPKKPQYVTMEPLEP